MSKTWKIVLGVLGGLVALGVLAIGVLIFLVAPAINNSEVIARIYGGPLPGSVSSVLAMTLDKTDMAVVMDNDSQTAIVFLQKTLPPAKGIRPFSEQNIPKVLESLDSTGKEIQTALSGTDAGKPSVLNIKGHTVHTIQFVDPEGQNSEIGVLNLKPNHQLVFIAVFMSEVHSKVVLENFLGKMPAVKKSLAH